jgi:hypothetical protein
MTKTGESYTTARLQLTRTKTEPEPDYHLAGMSDESVKAATGRTWKQWVTLLDSDHAAEKPHREIARYVSSLGTPSWWSQMVTVGYERIRGLRQRGQRRDGGYEAGKSKTFNVPLSDLFKAFSDDGLRNQWLEVDAVVRSRTAGKRMRLAWPDGTSAQLAFVAKGDSKSTVAVQHEKLPDRAAADAMKKVWGEQFERLKEFPG